MQEELQNAIRDGQEMMDRVQEKIKKMNDKITELMEEIDSLPNKYNDRSEQFVQTKRDELNAKLEDYKKILKTESEELTKQANSWLNNIKEDIAKKIAEKLKAMLGVLGSIFPE